GERRRHRLDCVALATVGAYGGLVRAIAAGGGGLSSARLAGRLWQCDSLALGRARAPPDPGSSPPDNRKVRAQARVAPRLPRILALGGAARTSRYRSCRLAAYRHLRSERNDPSGTERAGRYSSFWTASRDARTGPPLALAVANRARQPGAAGSRSHYRDRFPLPAKNCCHAIHSRLVQSAHGKRH